VEEQNISFGLTSEKSDDLEKQDVFLS